MNTPKVVIFSAPSGAGKTTIVRHLLKTEPYFAFSVSATTRPQRKHEIAGRDYYFLSKEEFKQKIAANEFVEWEEVYEGTFYGTLKAEVKRIHDLNKIALFDVDVKGGITLKNYYQQDALAIFIKTPNLEILAQRLRSRQTETEESLQKRLKKASYELTFENNFDTTIINQSLDETLSYATQLVKKFLNV